MGMIGNFGIIISILVLHSLRRASNAFLFHQCVLDFIKAAYCLPFAQVRHLLCRNILIWKLFVEYVIIGKMKKTDQAGRYTSKVKYSKLSHTSS